MEKKRMRKLNRHKYCEVCKEDGRMGRRKEKENKVGVRNEEEELENEGEMN
jgi:hypothetical protein